MFWAILVGVVFSALIYSLQGSSAIHRKGQRLRRPPDTLPFFGNSIRFLQPRQVLFNWFVQCQKRFGDETFEISVPTLPPGVVINDPANVEFVLKNEQSITKGEFFRKRSWDLFGYGIINANGELWRAQRKAGLKFFSGSNLDILIEEVLPDIFEHSRLILRKHAQDHTEFDLQKIFLDITTRVMGVMAYEMEIDASSPFSLAFDYASDHIGLRFQNPLYRLTEIFTGSHFRSALIEVKQFGKQIVRNARSRRSKEAFETLYTKEEPQFDTLIDALMEAFPNPEIVADSALNFLSAGRDTTAQSFTWTFYLLMRHPEVVDFVQEELRLLREPKTLERGMRKVSVADLQSNRVPRIMALFYEALRLRPPVPFELKQCQEDVILPDGTFLPRGSVVVWCVWAINRACQTFGADAECFRPSRWLGEDGKLVTKTPYEFPVFNGGPRACLGKKMAEVMAVFLLLNLLDEFEFEEMLNSAQADKERESQNSLTLPMKGGLPCKVRLRPR